MWASVIVHPVSRALTLYLLLLVVVVVVSLVFKPVLLPLAASFILYAVLYPMVAKLQGNGFSDSWSITLVLLLLTIFIIGSVVLLFPLLLEQIQELQTRLPLMWQKLSAFVDAFGKALRASMGVEFDTEKVIKRTLENIQSTGASIVVSSAGTMMQVAMALFLVPLITFFLLRDYRNMRNRFMGWLPNAGFELGWLIYHAVARQLQQYLRGVMLQSSIIAVFASIGFYLIGVDMAFLFGVLTGLFNLIPYIGPPLAIIPPLLVSLGGDEVTTLMMVGIPVVVLAAQLLDNLVIVPTLIANTVNLHPLVVLLGIIIFGALFGFIGMLIAIPFMAVSNIIFASLVFGLQGSDAPQ
ncbi:MAG: AI-2E family transporter [Gammaproteobacteria bacterium]|nr:AI-2E family transporter [Gammaproteobacteria bacterium]